jgi:hypothetical protein
MHKTLPSGREYIIGIRTDWDPRPAILSAASVASSGTTWLQVPSWASTGTSAKAGSCATRDQGNLAVAAR